MNATERSIFEQFDLWRAAGDYPRLDASKTYAVTGCGTSFNLSLAVAADLNQNGVRAFAVPGHEWAVRPQAYGPIDAVTIAISRSGESTETVLASRTAQKRGGKVIALTCERESSLAKLGDIVLYARTHAEEGIVMTASASLLLLMGLQLATPIAAPIAAAEAALTAMDRAGSDFLKNRHLLVYLGGGPLYGVAAEAALKLQEMSCTVTQYFHPLEYRHGPISLADSGVAMVLLYHPDTAADEAKLAKELQQKGAFVVGIGGPGDLSIPLDVPGRLRGLAALPALQLLGERMAQLKGLDTAAPRHLTKVVRIA